MRVRAQTATGDYTFGLGAANFLVDSAAAIAQIILTRLKLFTGEWWLDSTVGTPWNTKVLGNRTKPTYDAAVKRRIMTTFGVQAITLYQSQLSNRQLSITAQVLTIYGPVPITTTLGVQGG